LLLYMGMKDNLLELGATYDEINKECLLIVSQVKTKTNDFTDVQRLQYLLEKKNLNLKNNFLAVIDLAERHQVSVEKIKKLYTKYQETEKLILDDKKKLEELGLNNVVLGPKALGAIAANNSTVFIYINNFKKGLDIKVYPDDEETGWNQSFEMFSHQLKKNIEKVL